MKIYLVIVLSLFVSTAFSQSVGVNIGNKAPEIELSNPDGTVIKLSSLQGQMVLIDFWASWCGPCRRENPTVVKAYQNFKDADFKEGKGYTVYSVSLDKTKAAWQQAIVADKLSWTFHVSDLLGWSNTAAARYGVRGIPANFLINGNGIIVAKGLRGSALETTLNALKK